MAITGRENRKALTKRMLSLSLDFVLDGEGEYSKGNCVTLAGLSVYMITLGDAYLKLSAHPPLDIYGLGQLLGLPDG
jgi:hypothetical protein